MTDSEMSEFRIIQSFFYDLGASEGDAELTLGDDAAIVKVPKGARLCCSIDTVVEGVHFLPGTDPRHIATRALGSALSDLAAMGAQPSHFTLALTLPESKSQWLRAFASSLHEMACKYAVQLVGGDTTRGPLTVTIQVHGWLPRDKALQRDAARSGDVLVVSGHLGDAGAALRCLKGEIEGPQHHRDVLLRRFYSPEPRLALGRLLLDYANACIDISDGLLADAGHIAKASSLNVNINASRLPLSPALQHMFPEDGLDLAMNAGDDYELLFTMAESKLEALQRASDLPLSVIGRVGCAGQSVTVDGAEASRMSKGYQHFD